MKDQSRNEVFIKSCGVSILLETPDCQVVDYFINDPLPRNHLPCLKIIFGGNETEPDFTVKHYISNEPGSAAIQQLTHNSIKLTTSSKVPPGQFVFSLLPIFERLYEEKGVFGFHAASLKLNRWTIFIIGDTKCGKSINSAKLHFDLGAEFISDEKSVVDVQQGVISGGTDIISLRKDAVMSGHILADIDSQRLENSKSTPKLYYTPKQLPAYPVRMEKILYVFPHFSSLGFSAEEINDFTLSYLIYENITANIRACLSLFVFDSLPVPSQDNELLAGKRAGAIKDLLKNIFHKAIDVTGDLEHISQYIVEEVSK